MSIGTRGVLGRRKQLRQRNFDTSKSQDARRQLSATCRATAWGISGITPGKALINQGRGCKCALNGEQPGGRRVTGLSDECTQARRGVCGEEERSVQGLMGEWLCSLLSK